MKFSIICLTYKRVELLEESIFSVLQQTYKDFELLIINDCYSQKLFFEHPQIKIINLDEKFETLGEKRNFGKKNASGDLILQLDDDDLLLPNYLQDLLESIGDCDWLSIQRPIIYRDENNVYLSSTPLTNTLLYKRQTIGIQLDYEHINFDELTSYYDNVIRFGKGKGRFKQLKEYGYVYRKINDEKRKYSMVELGNKSIFEQNKFLESLENVTGDILLNPKWTKDYNEIIKNNKKILPSSTKNIEFLKTLEKKSDEWKKTKLSWKNALKFIESINSRGILSSVSDLVGFNNNSGYKVSDDIYEQRRLSCFGDKNRKITPCNQLQNDGKDGFYCGTCGCGKNPLSRLDGEGYTKLHYPQLECPLKRKGFSNYKTSDFNKPPLSVIIPVLNDQEELNQTIQSIRNTSPDNVEIIVIDDQSVIPVQVQDKTVKLTRLEERRGVGATRHLGAKLATSDYLLFVDSHMRFDPEWYNNAINRLLNNPSDVVWCATCLGLDENNMDLNKFKGAYHGAGLSLFDPKENQVFEGKWIPTKEGDDYEISCLMGACYFFHKSWFFHIGGTQSLKMWGSDEPLLSVKTYLAGGSIKLMKDVKIGHKFRSVSSYTTNVSYLIYNKLRSLKMIFSNELYETLKSRIADDGNKFAALEMMEKDKEEIKNERQYYKTIFVNDEKWLCEKFNLSI